MRTRNHRITLRLDEREHLYLERQVKRSGMRREPFLRAVILGKEIKEQPTELWAELVRQMSAVGNNINQIARIANATGCVRREDIAYIIDMQSKIWCKVKGL